MATPNLPLRNIHATESIPWWPLAPGWWLLIAATILVATAVWWWRRAQAQRRARVRGYFDQELERFETPAAQVGMMSELLRRAARLHQPQAAHLQGEEWLAVLNRGLKDRPFRDELGALILDGGFRRDVAVADRDRLRDAAERRFMRWVRNV